MKKFLSVILIIIFIVTLTSCGIESTDDKGTENISKQETSNTKTEQVQSYIYKAYGLQNVSDIPYDPVYEEQYNCYNVYFAMARCPECNGEVSIDPRITENDFGKKTIIWEDRVCCTNSHSNAFFNGYFDVAVQFIMIEK